MALLKKDPAKTVKTKTVSVNSNASLVDKYSKLWAGKSLEEVDATTTLKKISTGKKTLENGDTIHNLIIQFPKGDRIAFPLSRGFSESIEDDPTAILDGEFYAANKFNEDTDTEGEYPYTGPLYMSFGKPSGLSFDEEETLAEVGTETVEE